MQVVVEMQRSPDGRVVGVVRRDGELRRFCGWLELLGVLEAVSPAATPTNPSRAASNKGEGT